MMTDTVHTPASCTASIMAVQDALYVLNGKWKIPLIVALLNGPQRFKDIQQSLKVITPKVLSKELRDLELNDFVFRKVYDTVPVMITYELTAYSSTLNPIIDSLRDWGVKHKQRIVEVRKLEMSMEG